MLEFAQWFWMEVTLFYTPKRTLQEAVPWVEADRKGRWGRFYHPTAVRQYAQKTIKSVRRLSPG